jgi:hypothetical protein
VAVYLNDHQCGPATCICKQPLTPIASRYLQRGLPDVAHYPHKPPPQPHAWHCPMQSCVSCCLSPPQIRELAEAKEAQLNARILQLESQLHWLGQENERLKTARTIEGTGGAAASSATQAAAAGSASRGQEASRERLALLESDLRKSKRAEQKLQALLFRLRSDVAATTAPESQQQMLQLRELVQKLQDVRSLEYDVDLLTNKCRVSRRFLEGLWWFRGVQGGVPQSINVILPQAFTKAASEAARDIQHTHGQLKEQAGMHVGGKWMQLSSLHDNTVPFSARRSMSSWSRRQTPTSRRCSRSLRGCRAS